jgi:hypothetical protein
MTKPGSGTGLEKQSAQNPVPKQFQTAPPIRLEQFRGQKKVVEFIRRQVVDKSQVATFNRGFFDLCINVSGAKVWRQCHSCASSLIQSDCVDRGINCR